MAKNSACNVFAPGQSWRTAPYFTVSWDVAQRWCDEGLAESVNRGKAIRLIERVYRAICAQCIIFGRSFMEGVIEGSPYCMAVLRTMSRDDGYRDLVRAA